MKKIVSFCFILNMLFLPVYKAGAQQKIFNLVEIPGLNAEASDGIRGIAQDQQGYIWLTVRNKGLFKYDGYEIISYVHNPKDSNSITSAPLSSITIDSDNNIWIGTNGGGLDMLNIATNTFTHFRHNLNHTGSIANDTVTAILEDHSGQLWIGTYGGLDLLDRKTGRFTHYANKLNDHTSLSHNHTSALYEDRQGTLWVGCGSPFISAGEKPGDGGLNSFNKRTGTFTRFLHRPDNPGSLANNKVRAILEDSKGNFWIGTAGDGLHTLDRRTGLFTHYYYDSSHRGNLSRPYFSKFLAEDHITFIEEDAKGKIWIGTRVQGINEYDPQTQKLTHHGFLLENLNTNKPLAADTLTGFKDYVALKAINTRDSMLWITTLGGHVYNINPFNKIVIPYTNIHKNANTFYKENNGILWIGTNEGLIRKDQKSGKEKIFLHEPDNVNSLSNNMISAIAADDNRILWIGTDGGGLDKFDPAKNKFTHYKNDSTNASGLSNNIIGFLHLDQTGNLWISTADSGLDKMNTTTGEFSHFSYKDKDSNSLSSNTVFGIAEDKTNIWAGTYNGLNQLNKTTGKIKHYLIKSIVIDVYVDASANVWAGTKEALFNYNKTEDKFVIFDNAIAKIDKILNIIEDNQHNLWVTTTDNLFKIDKKRKNIRIYGRDNGVHRNNNSLFTNNYITKEGELFIGDLAGYYNFFPDNIIENDYPIRINITSFQIGGKEILPGSQSILRKPIYNSDKIKLAYNQNSFSIGFSAIDFRTPGEKRYLYMLENYDDQWHEAGADRKGYFYNLPTGNYVLRIRVINSAGFSNEKTLAIIITPPWWQRWWSITIFVLAFIGIVWGFFYYRSQRLRRENRLLEEKVNHRTTQLQQSLEKIKSTQSQLIQSEKMASLGELTAGIAHEIQNPLNFVNNFSEVNRELIDELEQEIDKGNTQEIKSIANDIKENELKISHHGKRADAIVKGMLQHSRISTGQKELTDINALADEYLRLSYHGLRAKDKSFNATIQTNFDEGIGKVNIVPQDMGRVLLNLFNNAFYAVTEKKKQQPENYEPTVTVTTKALKPPPKAGDGGLEIRVKDNGVGIPQKVLGKIFQPFFTTKPTGQGTGLGLSLAYDIITKEHGGQIKVETKEGEGAEFIIQLPIT